jgi:hypothetical protein
MSGSSKMNIVIYNNMFKIITILVLLLFMDSFAIAQNFLLDKNQSGSFLAGQIAKSDNKFSKALSIGYTIDGRIDLSLSASHVNGPHIGTHLIVNPMVSFIIIKQNHIPLSLSVYSEYQTKKYTRTDAIKDQTWAVGSGLYHKWLIGKTFSINPGIYFHRSFTNRSLDTYKEHLNSNGFGLQTSFLIKNFQVTPKVSHFREETVFSIEIGVIFFGAKSIESLN